jgi:hypothetical protein
MGADRVIYVDLPDHESPIEFSNPGDAAYTLMRAWPERTWWEHFNTTTRWELDEMRDALDRADLRP